MMTVLVVWPVGQARTSFFWEENFQVFSAAQILLLRAMLIMTHEAFHGVEWYACALLRILPAGWKAAFSCGRSSMIIPEHEVATSLRELRLNPTSTCAPILQWLNPSQLPSHLTAFPLTVD